MRIKQIRIIVAIFLCSGLADCVTVTCATAEPLVFSRLFPAGGQRGQTLTMDAEGSFPNWPLSVWCDADDIKVAAAEEKGKLTVVIAATAVPGQHWIRLYDSTGATRLRPFVVDTVSERLESDVIMSDANRNSIDLSQPQIINGVLAKNDEVDVYRVALQPGETLVASLTAHELLGSPMDAVMQLYDLKNKVVVAQVDDAPDRDPRIVFPSDDSAPNLDSKGSRASVRHSGDLAIRLFAFPEVPTGRIGFAGEKSFVYRLTLSTTGFVDYATPLSITPLNIDEVQLIGWGLTKEGEPQANVRMTRRDGNNLNVTIFRDGVPGLGIVPVTSTLALIEQSDCSRDLPFDCRDDVPWVVTGHLDHPGDEDAFQFTARSEIPLRLSITARRLGFPTDPYLEIVDSTGKRLHKSDDNGGLDCSIDFTPPVVADSTTTDSATTDSATANVKGTKYMAVVRDLYRNSGPRHLYRFAIEPIEPSYRLEVDNETYLAVPNEEAKVVVKVLRDDGFAGEIYLAAVGLPSSVTAPVVTSLPAGETAKQVELIVKGTEPFSASLQIIGTTRNSDRIVRAEAPTVIATDRTAELWITCGEPANPEPDSPADSISP